MKKLADLADVTVGFVGTMTPHYRDSGVPFLRSQNVTPHAVDLTDLKFIDPDFDQSIRKSALSPGDVVIVRTGKPGTAAVIPDSIEHANCADLVVVRPGPELNSRWFSYFMNSAARHAVSANTVGAVHQHFNVGAAKALKLPDVSLSEQQRVAEVLGALDDKIAANRAAISTGQNLIQAQWEQQSSGANEIRNLDEVVDLNPRTQLPAEGSHPFLDMKDLPQNGLLVDRWSERESRSGSKFRNGDTLLARITPCFENGKIGLVDFLPPDVTGLGSTEYIVLRPKDGVPQAVPYCIAASDPFRAHAARGMTGTSGRQRVQAMNIGDYPVGWPGKDALDRFGGFTDALIRRLSASRNENALLARTRDELLPLLMNGRITVKDAECAAEDVL